jgi:serine/threonine protein kinase
VSTVKVSEGPPELPGYVHLQRLGHGGYSDVYLYEQAMPRRKVAIKVLRTSDLSDSLRQQFTAEANAMASLADHPNIVPVFSADVAADGRPYLVMMYYPRPNLGERAAEAPFSVDEVLKIGIQIASAVETAHQAGILHRDIKPANILTNKYDSPGLTDFGIAGNVIAQDADDDTGVSVPWSPPEVLYASAPASVQSDVYSLGASLWHLLVGRSPFEVTGDDNSSYALMPRIRGLAVPETGRADVPTSLERLLRQSMAKDPAARPVSALALARTLQTIEQEQRLPRTDIVVLDEEDLAPRSQAETTDSHTQVRSPRRVKAQAPQSEIDSRLWAPPAEPSRREESRPSTSPVPEMPAAPTINRPRVVEPATNSAASAQAGDGRTIRRAVPADSAPITIAVEPSHRSPWARRGPLLILAAVVVVATAVAIVIGGRGGGSDRANAGLPPATTKNPPPQSAILGGGPGQVGTVHFATRRAGRSVTVSWHFSGQSASDRYQVRYGAKPSLTGAPAHSRSSASIVIPVPKHRVIYIQLLLLTANGSGASPNWQPSPAHRLVL